MLLLFDLDGTLVRSGAAGRAAFNRAFEQVYGVAEALERVRLDGNTDQVIIEQAFIEAFGRPAAETDDVPRFLARYESLLRREIAGAGRRYEVMVGAVELTEALARSEHFVVGLATGNIEAGARIKLEPSGLNERLPFGGFGSDAKLRADLVRVAIARGQDRAQRFVGRRFAKDEILVLGDTEYDIRAAHEAGATAVGVLSGSRRHEAMAAEGPDLLVDSLADPVLWSAVGLGAG